MRLNTGLSRKYLGTLAVAAMAAVACAAPASAGTRQQDHVYADEYGHRDCYRPPVFVKGRSYMYGLSDGQMPELSPCR